MSRKPDSDVSASCLPPGKAEEFRAQLERLLTSTQFRGSRRCQSLLRHVTEKTLAGDTGDLKERSLGVDVFGRAPDYDTSQDPIVRATAAEIRKKLAQYYQESPHDTEPRIDMLSGTYVPELRLNGSASHEEKPPSHRVRVIAASVLGLLVIAGTAAVITIAWKRSGVDKFWDPILRTKGPALIYMGQPVAYNLRSAAAQDAIQFRNDPTAPKTPAPAGDSIPRKDLVILPDRYIAFGDAECLVRVAALFEKYKKEYRLRGEGSASFADLRENAAVLIGAFDNPWTLRAAGQLRFVFVKDSDHDTDLVRDRQHPDKTDWKVVGAWPDWENPVDYAIVSRVLDVNTDRPFVIAAGITHHGTMAAGEFLTNPEYFAEAVKQLPSDWPKKNVQIVLRVPVVHRTAGHPHVIATQVW